MCNKLRFILYYVCNVKKQHYTLFIHTLFIINYDVNSLCVHLNVLSKLNTNPDPDLDVVISKCGSINKYKHILIWIYVTYVIYGSG